MNFRELFRRAAQAADDLERCNAQISAMRETISAPSTSHGNSLGISRGSDANDPMRKVDSLIEKEMELRQRSSREYETILDAAWCAIGYVSDDLSDTSAQVLSQHFLFGQTWEEVAHGIGRKSRTTPKNLAWSALDWLDSYYLISENDEGISIGVRTDAHPRTF